MHNPLLEEFLEVFQYVPNDVYEKWQIKTQVELSDIVRKAHYKGRDWEKYCDSGLLAHMLREDLVKRYAWAIPDEKSIELLRTLSPVVEVGAGTGYWASLVSSMGGVVRAFDTRPIRGNIWCNQAYHPIARGNEFRALRMYPTHTLFLCWPPYTDNMAYNAALAHKGEWLVYVGEGWGGCNANDEFFALIGEAGGHKIFEPDEPINIDPKYEYKHSIEIPTWRGLHDRLSVYQKIS